MKKYLITLLFIAGIVHSGSAQKNVSIDDWDFSKMIQPVPTQNMFIDSVYNIWCGSVVKGKNDKYYMFYSRWPRKNGHQDWVRHSEVALAVSDQPGGPFKHLKVVLPARGSEYWDGVNTHNPYVIVYKGKYYLYYIGVTGTAKLEQPAKFGTNAWWQYRNSQRVGVAVADNPEGDFKRADQPVFSVNPDTTAFDAVIVSNPAVTVNDKGQVLLMYKGVEKNGKLAGGRVKIGVAFADNPTGPFKRYGKPIMEPKEKSDHWMLAEDPYLWFANKKYYAIVRDVVGKYTGQEGALALLSSSNAIDWEVTKHPLVTPPKIKYADGRTSDDRMERPFLIFDKAGMPIILYGAMGINGREHSMNVAIPLKQP